MRAIVLLLSLMLCACDGIDFPAEEGAAPRPMPEGMQVKIVEWDLQKIRTTIPHPDTQQGYIGFTRDDQIGKRCLVIIPKASSEPDYVSTVSPAEQDHVRIHELRHCTGQRHDIIRRSGDEVVVWRP